MQILKNFPSTSCCFYMYYSVFGVLSTENYLKRIPFLVYLLLIKNFKIRFNFLSSYLLFGAIIKSKDVEKICFFCKVASSFLSF